MLQRQWQTIIQSMTNTKKKLDFNGGWTLGEAAHHVGKRMTAQTIRDKKKYSRKQKHKGNESS